MLLAHVLCGCIESADPCPTQPSFVSLDAAGPDNGRRELFWWLVDQGMDLEHRDTEGQSALLCAAERGHRWLIDALITEHNQNPFSVDNDGWGLIAYAGREGNADLVDHLVNEYGLDIHVQDRHGKSIVLIAAMGGHTDLVRHLVRVHDMGIHTVNRQRWGVLHWFAVNNHGQAFVDIYTEVCVSSASV